MRRDLSPTRELGFELARLLTNRRQDWRQESVKKEQLGRVTEAQNTTCCNCNKEQEVRLEIPTVLSQWHYKGPFSWWLPDIHPLPFSSILSVSHCHVIQKWCHLQVQGWVPRYESQCFQTATLNTASDKLPISQGKNAAESGPESDGWPTAWEKSLLIPSRDILGSLLTELLRLTMGLSQLGEQQRGEVEEAWALMTRHCH